MRTPRPLLHYLYLLAFILVSALIIFLSLQSGTDSSTQSGFLVNVIVWFFNIFKVSLSVDQLSFLHLLLRKAIGHFGLFLIDGIFGYLTIKHFINAKLPYQVLITLGMGVFLAALTESLQAFAPDRGPSIVDAAIDICGYIVGAGLIAFVTSTRIKPQKHKNTLSNH